MGRNGGIGGVRAATLVALGALLCLASVAHALPDAGEDTGVDTMYTPRAKKPPENGPAVWSYVSGARYDESREEYEQRRASEGLPVPYEVDFHGVAFRTPEGGLPAENGFAGGSEKRGDIRVPAMYRYDEEREGWERDPTFVAKGVGYIADITWLADDRALAVGGDGVYPRREAAGTFCDSDDPMPYTDPTGAGLARVWLYDSGAWYELRQGVDFDESMGALTALAAYDMREHSAAGQGREGEFAVAGGLCQIWHWSSDADGEGPGTESGFLQTEDGSGEFQHPANAGTVPTRIDRCCGLPDLPTQTRPGLHYRVRALTFVRIITEDPDSDDRTVEVRASTSGCCQPTGPDERPTGAATLTYIAPESGGIARGSWSANFDSTGWGNPEATPDSAYSVTATRGIGSHFQSQTKSGYVLTPGGPPPASSEVEPASRIATGVNQPNGAAEDPWVSSLRLRDGDGDVGGANGFDIPPATSGTGLCVAVGGPACRPVGGDIPTGEYDGLPDWAVGEIAGSGRGVLVGTDPRQLQPPDAAVESPEPFESRSDSCPTSITDPQWYTCNWIEPPTSWPGNAVEQQYEPTNQDRAQAALRSWRLLTLDSSPLNAIDVLDADDVGWVAGDHGVLLKLTVERAVNAGDEPPAPTLGSGETASSDATPYQPFRGQTGGRAGLVPPLGSESVEAPEPGLIPYGSPNPAGAHTGNTVRQIVANRDGSEAWALGNRNSGISLFHFDGQSWQRCDPVDVPGASAAEEACEDLAPLASDPRVRIVAAARVPLENDIDPTNDDDFEVVAAAGVASNTGMILRYQQGRWEIESSDGPALGWGTTVASLAFATPREGWFAPGTGDLWHFDGDGWFKAGSAGRLAGAEVAHVSAAGDRVYLAGSRIVEANVTVRVSSSFPLILHKDRDESQWHGSPDGSDGGYDPAFGHTEVGQDPPPADHGGSVSSLAVFWDGTGEYGGWAVGEFGVDATSNNVLGSTATSRPDARLMRLDHGGKWQRFRDPGALRDLPPGSAATSALPHGGATTAVICAGRLCAHDPERDAFEVVQSDVPVRHGTDIVSEPHALGPDGAGGAWAAYSAPSDSRRGGTYFYRFTPRPPKPVFSEAPSPIPNGQRTITALAGAADGTIWAATDSSELYRYDRVLGWDRVAVPGWQTGRIVTASSPVNAIALDAGGEGLVVGSSGRIARIGAQVALDPAAGVLCASKPPPCGTARDLLSVDIASDGAAIAGGDARALLWRPAGGDFRTVEPPRVSRSTSFVGVEIADDGRTWVGTDTGEIHAGTRSSRDEWSWRRENVNEHGELLSLGLEDPRFGKRVPLRIRSMDLDSEGRGYAVGDQGLILERTGEQPTPWRRIDTGYQDELSVVTLAVGGGPGALIGGQYGIVLTKTSNGFALANPPQFPSWYSLFPNVKGAALVPGIEPGQSEAWVAIRPDNDFKKPSGALGPTQLLHYSSDPTEPLLNPYRGARPIADVPASREGELSLAAFGKSDCRLPAAEQCTLLAGSAELSEVLKTRVREELLARGERPGGPRLSLFTGDGVDSAASPAASETRDQLGDLASDFATGLTGVPGNITRLHAWRAQIADPLSGGGLPLFGTVGSQDLSEVNACDSAAVAFGLLCTSTKEHADTGENLAWREEMADQHAPWGAGEEVESGSLSFEPVGDADLSIRHNNVEVDVDAGDASASKTLNTGGASTHYAVDVIDDSREENQEVARIVFVDTSLRSLQASDPIQQPFEPDGQLQWLEKVLCVRGETNVTHRCDREPHQQAIVVTNTPTYSYGPGVLSDTNTVDGTQLEAVLMRHEVSALITGRIGWNGLYYATAPGVHEPCPGGDYPEESPPPGTRICGQGANVSGTPADDLPSAEDLSQNALGGLLPVVVASSAGGNLANDNGEASDGFWQGYTIVRLARDGDPRKLIVEQRPVYDWIGIEGQRRVLDPGERMRLGGYARSPIGVPPGIGYVARFDRIDGPAVTHRYDLLLADPEEPWLPCEASDEDCVKLAERLAGPRSFDSAAASGRGSAQDDKVGVGAAATVADENPCELYVCLPENVATVDDQTGAARAGNGKYPDTFAIGMLSVGDHVATYPLYFKRSPAFVVSPAAGFPAIPTIPSETGAPPPPPAPPNPQTPEVPPIESPPLPSVPPIAPLQAAEPPEPAPPAPPAPPPPTEQPSPLNLALAPPSITIATPTAVIQPPTPPVNPAPPGGARREARQRQAAAQKSGADNDESQEGGSETPDSLDSRTQPATRLDRRRAEPSFTALAHAEQPSAWAQGLLYGGGVTLAAAVLALGWSGVRPTPRRRASAVPAPARAWSRHR